SSRAFNGACLLVFSSFLLLTSRSQGLPTAPPSSRHPSLIAYAPFYCPRPSWSHGNRLQSSRRPAPSLFQSHPVPLLPALTLRWKTLQPKYCSQPALTTPFNCTMPFLHHHH